MFCSRKMEHHAESHDNRHLAEIVRQLDRQNAERSTHAGHNNYKHHSHFK